MTLQRDQLENALHQVQGNGEEFQKRAKHLEQALEKVKETRRNETRRNEANRDKTRRNETRRNETKRDETKRDETRRNEANRDKTRRDNETKQVPSVEFVSVPASCLTDPSSVTSQTHFKIIHEAKIKENHKRDGFGNVIKHLYKLAKLSPSFSPEVRICLRSCIKHSH